jgi:uncharacterized protein
MKSETTTLYNSITVNQSMLRYELLSTSGNLSFLQYVERYNTILLTHTEVAPEDRGKGIGQELVRQVLTKIQREGKKFVPLCPFVDAFIRRNHQFQSSVTHL